MIRNQWSVENTIVVGDCLDVMAALPDGIFQTCVTSPPYWGLRDYGLPSQVWGGDAGCEHEWGAYIRPGMSGGTASAKVQIKGQDNFQIVPDSEQAFCQHCNAWRGSLGLEPTPELYVQHLVDIFREVRRVLRDDGTLWLNMGDSYAQGGKRATKAELEADAQRASKKNYPTQAFAGYKGWDRSAGTAVGGLKVKDLCGIPWRLAFALQADGWWLRSDIIWEKPNCMPESVRDRPTKAHEYVFLLAKSKSYYYDQDAIREPSVYPNDTRKPYAPGQVDARGNGHDRGGGQYQERDGGKRNKRTVWTIATQPYSGAHFATFPPALIEPCIKAGSSERGACPECGKAWERVVERKRLSRPELSPDDPRYRPNRYKGKHEAVKGEMGADCGYTTSTTIGWQPACKCNAGDPVPQLVLDPFIGAGTTGLVAEQLGRDWFGIELSPEYVEMALERIEKDRLERSQSDQ